MDILNSLKKIVNFLEEHNYPYMIFGGIATAYYGYTRQTFDIDVKIYLDLSKEIRPFIKNVSQICKIRTENPVQFIKETSVLPIIIDEVGIDIVFAQLPFEINAIKRAVPIDFENLHFDICAIEDLVIQKSVSTRDKDWIDIDNLIKMNLNKIDWNYLLSVCTELSHWLETPINKKIKEIKKRYE